MLATASVKWVHIRARRRFTLAISLSSAAVSLTAIVQQLRLYREVKTLLNRNWGGSSQYEVRIAACFRALVGFTVALEQQRRAQFTWYACQES